MTCKNSSKDVLHVVYHYIVIISQMEVFGLIQNHNMYFWLLPYSYIYYVMLIAETLSQSSDPHRGYHE